VREGARDHSRVGQVSPGQQPRQHEQGGGAPEAAGHKASSRPSSMRAPAGVAGMPPP
jgi:hypothetical protein